MTMGRREDRFRLGGKGSLLSAHAHSGCSKTGMVSQGKETKATTKETLLTAYDQM